MDVIERLPMTLGYIVGFFVICGILSIIIKTEMKQKQNKHSSSPSRIFIIKRIREETGMSLQEAKNHLDQLNDDELSRFMPEQSANSSNSMKKSLSSHTFDLNNTHMITGHEFEYFCAEVLRQNGFTNIKVTKGSGDQGVDITATNNGVKYAIQCKNYSNALGNTPVQEIYSGVVFYNCNKGVVLTNSTFTKGAIELAKKTNIELWDKTKLQQLINNCSDIEELNKYIPKSILKSHQYSETGIREDLSELDSTEKRTRMICQRLSSNIKEELDDLKGKNISIKYNLVPDYGYINFNFIVTATGTPVFELEDSELLVKIEIYDQHERLILIDDTWVMRNDLKRKRKISDYLMLDIDKLKNAHSLIVSVYEEE